MSAPPPCARQPNNLVVMLLAIVPGFGQLYLDHYLLGAVLFGAFVTASNGLFLGISLHTLDHPGLVRWVSLLVLLGIWLGSAWHAYRLSYGTDRVALASAKADLMREALLDYLRDDLDDARRKLERAVALDVDWLDPDPLFHLGVVQLRSAERLAQRGDATAARQARRRAQTAFRRCLARDPERKWQSEIEVEMRRLRRGVSLSGQSLAPIPALSESSDMLPRLADLQAAGLDLALAPEGPPPPTASSTRHDPLGDTPLQGIPVRTFSSSARTGKASRRLLALRVKQALEQGEAGEGATPGAGEALSSASEPELDMTSSGDLDAISAGDLDAISAGDLDAISAGDLDAISAEDLEVADGEDLDAADGEDLDEGPEVVIMVDGDDDEDEGGAAPARAEPAGPDGA